MSLEETTVVTPVILKAAVKRLLRAITAFLIVLRHDPVEAKEKIEEFFAGIRG